MKLFQIVVVPILVLLALRELLRLRHGLQPTNLVRFLLWSAAAVLVLDPDLTVPAARLFGIERGVDLVTYTFMLVSTTAALYFYGRHERLERKLVQLARSAALSEARRGAGSPTDDGTPN